MGWLSKFNCPWQVKGMVLCYLYGLLIPDLLRLCCLSDSSVIPLGLLKMKETLLFFAKLVFC